MAYGTTGATIIDSEHVNLPVGHWDEADAAIDAAASTLRERHGLSADECEVIRDGGGDCLSATPDEGYFIYVLYYGNTRPDYALDLCVRHPADEND